MPVETLFVPRTKVAEKNKPNSFLLGLLLWVLPILNESPTQFISLYNTYKSTNKILLSECEIELYSVNGQSSVDLKCVADLHRRSLLPRRKPSFVFLRHQMLSMISERLNSPLTTIVKTYFASFPLHAHITESSRH